MIGRFCAARHARKLLELSRFYSASIDLRSAVRPTLPAMWLDRSHERSCDVHSANGCRSSRRHDFRYAPNTMTVGTVTFFDDDKGYGFIAQDGGDDLFVHRSNILGDALLGSGQRVEFDIVPGRRRQEAQNVRSI